MFYIRPSTSNSKLQSMPTILFMVWARSRSRLVIVCRLNNNLIECQILFSCIGHCSNNIIIYDRRHKSKKPCTVLHCYAKRCAGELVLSVEKKCTYVNGSRNTFHKTNNSLWFSRCVMLVSRLTSRYSQKHKRNMTQTGIRETINQFLQLAVQRSAQRRYSCSVHVYNGE